MSDDPRSATNPLFNGNKLKLGVFAFNGAGAFMTKIPEQFDPTWNNTLDVAQQADQNGWEALVPYARWRSFVRPGHPSGNVFECYTWAAAVAASTSYSSILSTVHVPLIHPIVGAKMGATVDHVSGGRFGLNLVCGWFSEEIEMFGAVPMGHEQRYDYAGEWISCLKRVWSEDAAFDFNGSFFQLKQAMTLPKPIQKPYPVLMNAGGSPTGRQFVARHCDMAFVPAVTDDEQYVRDQVRAYRKQAWEEQHREIEVWSSVYAVHRDTFEDAVKFVDYYATEHGDDEYADSFMAEQLANAQTMPPAALAAIRRNFKAGYSGIALLGPGDRITDQLIRLSECGLDGILLVWVDYNEGVRSFNREVMPLLEQAGLRKPFRRPNPT
ncbi:MAG: LLM class flavin-dependent oxidoreductase [Candidatus Binataceae bacterium]|nr:LLM class flavin-dependent oxidoreductase [Candidatus Binataceae bacterium]